MEFTTAQKFLIDREMLHPNGTAFEIVLATGRRYDLLQLMEEFAQLKSKEVIERCSTPIAILQPAQLSIEQIETIADFIKKDQHVPTAIITTTDSEGTIDWIPLTEESTNIADQEIAMQKILTAHRIPTDLHGLNLDSNSKHV
jgi:hypothetical protein